MSAGGANVAAVLVALDAHGGPCDNAKCSNASCLVIRDVYAALADSAGALAKHDAEVWDEGHYAGWVNHIYASADEPKQKRNPYRADRIEAQS